MGEGGEDSQEKAKHFFPVNVHKSQGGGEGLRFNDISENVC